MLEITLGAAGAIATIVFFRGFRAGSEPKLWAQTLVVAALIYVVFALVGGGASWIGIETGGLLLYGAVAALGMRVSPWFLAAGWLAHVAWDVGLHAGDAAPFVPGWYPAACVGYDVLVALYIAWACRTWVGSDALTGRAPVH